MPARLPWIESCVVTSILAIATAPDYTIGIALPEVPTDGSHGVRCGGLMNSAGQFSIQLRRNILVLVLGVLWLDAPMAAPQVTTGQAAPIRAGSELDYPPFCVVQSDGTAAGFSVELMVAALQAVGRTVAFKTGEWAQIKRDLAEGRLQALPLVARTPERESIFDFTVPYLSIRGTIVIRQDTMDIHGPADLKNKRIAVLRGDAAEEYLQRAGLGAIIEPYGTFAEALRNLSAGGCDAVVIQKLLALQLIQQAKLTNLITVGPPLFEQEFCFATRKGDRLLLSSLSEGLSIVMADGTFRRLYARWFSRLETGGRSLTRLVIGGTSDNPPYEFLDHNGQPSGMYVDMTRAIARRLGFSVDIRLGNREDAISGLEHGELDAIQGLLYSPERSMKLAYSVASNTIQYIIVRRKGTPDLPDLPSLSGKLTLVAAGSIADEAAGSLGYAAQLIRVPTQEEAMSRLAQGTGDCALVVNTAALFWIKSRAWSNLVAGETAVLSADAGYAVIGGNDEVLELLQNGLVSLKGTDEWRRIQDQWLSPYESGIVARRFFTVMFWIILPLLVLLGSSFAWSKTLQKRVALRTMELSTEVASGRRLERELRDLSESLEQQVRERTGQLEASNRELEAFTYSVSHDLRAPLRAIDGYVQIFKELHGQQLDEESSRICGVIQHNAHSMQCLIDDLLAFSRAGKTELHMVTVDMRRLAETVVDEMKSLEDHARIDVAIGPLPTVKGDEMLLRQVWANLIGNAFKFTSKKERAIIRIDSERVEGRTIFSVIDNGAGFDMRYAGKLFGVFQRLHSQNEFEGTGVGLAIVQRLVQRHGGSVWAKGEPGVGATFSFSMPSQEGG